MLILFYFLPCLDDHHRITTWYALCLRSSARVVAEIMSHIFGMMCVSMYNTSTNASVRFCLRVPCWKARSPTKISSLVFSRYFKHLACVLLYIYNVQIVLRFICVRKFGFWVIGLQCICWIIFLFSSPPWIVFMPFLPKVFGYFPPLVY